MGLLNSPHMAGALADRTKQKEFIRTMRITEAILDAYMFDNFKFTRNIGDVIFNK